MSCAGCRQSITDEESISCSIENCKKVFHLTCAAADHFALEEAKIWVCPDCRASTRRGGDNTNTPIRYYENVTLRRKNSEAPSLIYSSPDAAANSLEPVLAEIRLLRLDMAKMQTAFTDRLDTLSAQLLTYETRISQLEDKAEENTQLKLQVFELQEALNKQAHESLRGEVEILGLTEIENENPYHLVMNTAVKIGVELDERDLDYASRAGQISKNESSEKVTLPRPLIVSFTRRTKRNEFLEQAKARQNTLDSKDIVGSGPERKTFVNERLTFNTRRLFRAAKACAKEHGFLYCWTRNGNVYIRKREGRDGSPPIRIRSSEDLQRLSREEATCHGKASG